MPRYLSVRGSGLTPGSLQAFLEVAMENPASPTTGTIVNHISQASLRKAADKFGVSLWNRFGPTIESYMSARGLDPSNPQHLMYEVHALLEAAAPTVLEVFCLNLGYELPDAHQAVAHFYEVLEGKVEEVDGGGQRSPGEH